MLMIFRTYMRVHYKPTAHGVGMREKHYTATKPQKKQQWNSAQNCMYSFRFDKAITFFRFLGAKIVLCKNTNNTNL